MTRFLQILFAQYFLYDAGISLVKLSALLFYTRIFTSQSPRFRHIIWMTHVLVLLWLLGIWFATLFLCSPIQKQWNPTVAGNCGDTGGLWLGSAIPSVIIDVIILALPMPMLWRLKLMRSRKILITGVFVCGYWSDSPLRTNILYHTHSYF